MVTELRVHMDCSGCERKIRKALQRIKGVDEVEIDMGLQKVTVMGWADQKKVLKTVRKTGRRAELWQFPYNPEMRNHNFIGHHHYYNQTYATTATTLAADPPPSASAYNYYKHGYDTHTHTHAHTAATTLPYYRGNSNPFWSQNTNAFSDENPHGCAVM